MIPFKEAAGILATHIAKGEDERQDWDRWQSWYLANYWQEDAVARSMGAIDGFSPDSELKLETNYPYAFLDTMIANICPTNPVLTINARKKSLKDAAKAREDLINDTLHRDRLHSKSWDMSTFVGLCGRGFSKTVWDEKSKHPRTRIINPRNIFYDMSCDWADIRYVIEAVPLTKAEFDKRVADGKYDKDQAERAQFGTMPSWMRNPARDGSYLNDASKAIFQWVIVYEFYDFTGGKFFHLLEGAQDPLYEGGMPYKYVQNPFTMMIFNKSPLENTGISDVKLIARIQERLNEIDSLELWHTHTSIPKMVINTALVDDPESTISAIQNATGPGDAIRLSSTNMAPISSIIDFTKSPQLSPSFQIMRERCTSLIEFILGIPAYSRGSYGGAEVATELALVDTATRTRNGRRIKVIEDWIVEVAKKSLGLWKEYMQLDDEFALRQKNSFDTSIVDRVKLAFPQPDEFGKLPQDDFEDEWAYDYEPIPYSPTENHRLVQLQKLQQYMTFLIGNPGINQEALMTKLVELLGMDEIRQDPKAAPPQMAIPGQPEVPGIQNKAGISNGMAVAQGGASPENVDQFEAILPAGARQMADQPK